MPVFGVCSKLVEQSARDNKYLLDVLYRFLQDNPLRIAIDANSGQILKHYADAAAAAKSSDLKRWLRFLGRRFFENVELIDVDCSHLNERETFIEISRFALPERCLLTWSLQDYREYQDQLGEKDVELVDRVEAVARVRKYDRATNELRAPEVKSGKQVNKMPDKYVINASGGSTVVIDATLVDSLKHINSKYSKEVGEALVEIGDHVKKSSNEEALELFKLLNAELARPEPKKATLERLWANLLRTLPDIAKMTEAVSKVATVFGASS